MLKTLLRGLSLQESEHEDHKNRTRDTEGAPLQKYDEEE